MAKTGRPTTFTKEIADEICARLAQAESLRSICRDEHMPNRSTVTDWVIKDTQGFASQYARAKEIQADVIFEELFDIADDGSNDWMTRETERGNIVEVANHEHISRSKLRIDTRRWALSKMLPKKYGDKIINEITNPDGSLAPITKEQRLAKLEILRKEAARRAQDGSDLV